MCRVIKDCSIRSYNCLSLMCNKWKSFRNTASPIHIWLERYGNFQRELSCVLLMCQKLRSSLVRESTRRCWALNCLCHLALIPQCFSRRLCQSSYAVAVSSFVAWNPFFVCLDSQAGIKALKSSSVISRLVWECII